MGIARIFQKQEPAQAPLGETLGIHHQHITGLHQRKRLDQAEVVARRALGRRSNTGHGQRRNTQRADAAVHRVHAPYEFAQLGDVGACKCVYQRGRWACKGGTHQGTDHHTAGGVTRFVFRWRVHGLACHRPIATSVAASVAASISRSIKSQIAAFCQCKPGRRVA